MRPSTNTSPVARSLHLLAAAVACLAPFAAAQQKSAPEPLAVLAGHPIYESQLTTDDKAQLLRMRQQISSVRLRALHAVLDQKLVEDEAKKKGLTVQELLQSEVVAKVADPTGDQVSVYYQSHPAQFKQPLEEVRDRVRQGLKDLDIQKARMAYIQGLFQQAVNSGQLTVAAAAPVVDMTADPARLRGDRKAPITIVEFSDFSCSFCRQAETTLNALLAKYPGQVKVGYRDYPLRQLHPQAQLAAEASHCAVEQGKFWEYHDLLFANVGKQDHDDLLGHARTLKLDEKQFETCLSSGRYRQQIDQDILLAAQSGVVAAPGFFVNGTFVSGAQPASAFEKIIQQQLPALSQK